jgi:broad specificity phosphatase PhoE
LAQTEEPDRVVRVTARLLLIRHGRVDFDSTEFRPTHRGRQWDPPLDERGREQAGLLTARLASIEPPAAIFVSPFRRCLETAEPYARAVGMRPIVDEGLAEVFIGEWEGVRFEEIFAANPETLRQYIHRQEPMFHLAPGAESGEELRARVVPAIDGLLKGIDDGNVIMVTHGGVINAYLGHVIGLQQDMFFLPENASISTVDVDGNQRRMRYLNDVAHLALPGIFAPPAGADV